MTLSILTLSNMVSETCDNHAVFSPDFSPNCYKSEILPIFVGFFAFRPVYSFHQTSIRIVVISLPDLKLPLCTHNYLANNIKTQLAKPLQLFPPSRGHARSSPSPLFLHFCRRITEPITHLAGSISNPSFPSPITHSPLLFFFPLFSDILRKVNLGIPIF